MIISFALAAASVLAVPGVAAAPVVVAPRAHAEAPAAAPASPVEKRYCVQQERTGTRMTRKECRTRSEWLDRGFDPLARD